MGEFNGILELIDVGEVGAQKCKFINLALWMLMGGFIELAHGGL